MLVLSNEEIEKALTMDLCIEALTKLYRDMVAGLAVNGPRADLLVPIKGSDNYYAFKSMAGVAPRFGVAALRLNSDVLSWPVVDGVKRRVKVPAAPGNRWVGLVMLFSSATGEPLAIFPDGVVQRMRVGGTNAVAARYLARAEASRIGLLGSGWQAGAQLMGLCAVRKIGEIKVYSPNSENRRRFAREISAALNIDVQPVDSAAEAARDVDILAAATNAVQPIIDPKWLRPGLHLSCIKRQEADEAVFERCDLVVLHSIGQLKEDAYVARRGGRKVPEVREPGWWRRVRRGRLNGKRLYELSEVVAGKVAGRAGPEQITFFMNNIGIGLQFAAVGAVIYQQAKLQGLGREIPTDWFLQNVHP